MTINPFGEDDSDFEINWLIDRFLRVSVFCNLGLLFQIPVITSLAQTAENASSSCMF